MSLAIRQLIENGTDLAFSLTPDVQKSGTYRRRSGTSYDTDTGTSTPSDTDVAITFIVTPYSERELVQEEPRDAAQPIQMGDEKVVIDLRILSLAGVTDMDTDDLVLETGGPERQVLEIFRDPTETVAVLHTRRVAL